MKADEKAPQITRRRVYYASGPHGCWRMLVIHEGGINMIINSQPSIFFFTVLCMKRKMKNQLSSADRVLRSDTVPYCFQEPF